MIEQLKCNKFNMQRFAQSHSRHSFSSYREEFRTNSKLRFYVGDNYKILEVTKEGVLENDSVSKNIHFDNKVMACEITKVSNEFCLTPVFL